MLNWGRRDSDLSHFAGLLALRETTFWVGGEVVEQSMVGDEELACSRETVSGRGEGSEQEVMG